MYIYTSWTPRSIRASWWLKTARWDFQLFSIRLSLEFWKKLVMHNYLANNNNNIYRVIMQKFILIIRDPASISPTNIPTTAISFRLYFDMICRVSTTLQNTTLSYNFRFLLHYTTLCCIFPDFHKSVLQYPTNWISSSKIFLSGLFIQICL